MTTLHDRVALITGASRGIGAAIARRFVQSGAKVALAGRDEERLGVLVQALGSGVARSFPGDLLEAGVAAGLPGRVVEEWGRFDILVNNAACYQPAELTATDRALLERHFSLNVLAAHELSCAAHEALASSGNGVVLNVLSTLAHRPVPGVAAYSASKAALRSLTQSMALEWAVDGIRVVGISPGVVATELHTDEHLRQMGPVHPLGRVGRAEEIAEAAHFLVSDLSAWTTGSILEVDGGIHLG